MDARAGRTTRPPPLARHPPRTLQDRPQSTQPGDAIEYRDRRGGMRGGMPTFGPSARQPITSVPNPTRAHPCWSVRAAVPRLPPAAARPARAPRVVQYRTDNAPTDPLLLGTLLLPSTATAQDQMRFRAMDRNRDGVVTRAEWQGRDQSFRQQDRNGDGILSGDEVRVAPGVGSPGPAGAPIDG